MSAELQAEIKKAIDDGLTELKSKNTELSKSFEELDKKYDHVEKTGTNCTTQIKDSLAKVKENEDKIASVEKSINDLVEKFSARQNGAPAGQTLGSAAAKGLDLLIKDNVNMQTSKGETFCNLEKGLHHKDITGGAGSAGATFEPDNVGYKQPNDQPLTIRDLLTSIPTNSDAVEWFMRNIFTNNAAMQAGEGANKAKSDLTFIKQSTPVQTVAHWFAASRQVLGDSPRLREMIDNHGVYGLKLVEDAQLLNGDGLGNNLTGLVTAATAYVPTALETRIDAIRRAIKQSEQSYLPATGIVLNPNDWAEIELLKDDNSNYIFASPQDASDPRMWGRKIAPSFSMNEGDFLTGAFSMGATLYDREMLSVRMSESHDNFFIQNMVAILIEERIALAVEYPTAFITGTFA